MIFTSLKWFVQSHFSGISKKPTHLPANLFFFDGDRYAEAGQTLARMTSPVGFLFQSEKQESISKFFKANKNRELTCFLSSGFVLPLALVSRMMYLAVSWFFSKKIPSSIKS